jgi:N6-adenosine-specific RNA methylase IME4
MKHYGAILSDPPWRFQTWSEKGKGRSADRHYKTMTTQDIANMPVAQLAKKDAVLFLWATWPMLNDAMYVIQKWGFVYKTCAFAWTKIAKPYDAKNIWTGTGYWTRANTEVCLLATRGKPRRQNRNIPQVILEPRREHSRKPDCVRPRIERLVKGPYLELFARSERKRWTALFSDEVGKFDDLFQKQREKA